MNEMYELSIVTHYYSVIGVLGVILLNMFLVYKMSNISSYKKMVSIFAPLSLLPLSSVIFTGVIMMAAKHLDFTIENLLMIFFALVMIVLEVQRGRTLKIIKSNSIAKLQKSLFTIYILELVFTLSISIWMVL